MSGMPCTGKSFCCRIKGHFGPAKVLASRAAARRSGRPETDAGALAGPWASFTTRQSRKGEISSWKAYAPAHAGKLAIEAVDRCMRGEGAPSPIYEGEDSVIAYMLDGKNGKYTVPLPEIGEEKRAILETYTKEHSAEYQSQALIDLAARMKTKIKNFDDVKEYEHENEKCNVW